MTALDKFLEEVEGKASIAGNPLARAEVRKLIAIVRRQREALDGITRNVALCWYVKHFRESEAPSQASSGIVATIHNRDMEARAAKAFENARACNADVERIVKDE